jgi:hypothetical protein
MMRRSFTQVVRTARVNVVDSSVRGLSAAVVAPVGTEVKYNAKIDVNSLILRKTEAPKPKLPLQDLVFGKTFSDHMLVVDWDAKNGWHKPVIMPYGDLSISPASTGLHYGLQVSVRCCSQCILLFTWNVSVCSALRE